MTLQILCPSMLALTLVCVTQTSSGAEQPGEDAGSQAATLRARGLQYGYDLDYERAEQAFADAAAADPADAAAHRLSAATTWIQMLFAHGAVTVDDYLGQARAELPRSAPDPARVTAFHRAINRAIALSEERLLTSPNDAAAHYQVGAAYACLASYIATVEGRLVGSLGPARRAYREHQRTLQLDPGRHDAALVIGIYQYVVASLSAPLRLMARIAGFGANRERAVRLVESAAAYASDAQPNALFTLILVYNREGRYDDALRVIARLRERFPRNRLLWLEQATTAIHADRADHAKAAVEQGLAWLAGDPRPRAFGEEARWAYVHGTALAASGSAGAAEASLRQALATTPFDWLRGRTHIELGRLAAASGNRQQAAAEFRRADRLCRAAEDDECRDALRRLERAR